MLVAQPPQLHLRPLGACRVLGPCDVLWGGIGKPIKVHPARGCGVLWSSACGLASVAWQPGRLLGERRSSPSHSSHDLQYPGLSLLQMPLSCTHQCSPRAKCWFTASLSAIVIRSWPNVCAAHPLPFFTPIPFQYAGTSSRHKTGTGAICGVPASSQLLQSHLTPHQVCPIPRCLPLQMICPPHCLDVHIVCLLGENVAAFCI